MRVLLMTVGLLLSGSALAHFQIGTYKGLNQDGLECTFTIHNKVYVNNMKHPLNERVDITVGHGLNKETFVHLPLVDHEKGTVRPKKEILTHVKAIENGGYAYELHMNDKGPFAFYTILEIYGANGTKVKTTCTDLVYQD